MLASSWDVLGFLPVVEHTRTDELDGSNISKNDSDRRALDRARRFLVVSRTIEKTRKQTKNVVASYQG